MKKTASILLIVILTTTFLYNVVGLHLLLSLQKEQIWIEQMQKISDSEFKVIKVNASLYSFIEDSELEFVNENIIINGKTFHVFKKQIKDNIISLYYLPNKHQNSTEIILKKIMDNEVFQDSALNKKSLEKIFKAFQKDYVDLSKASLSFCLSDKSVTVVTNFFPVQTLHRGFTSMEYSPPEYSFTS